MNTILIANQVLTAVRAYLYISAVGCGLLLVWSMVGILLDAWEDRRQAAYLARPHDVVDIADRRRRLTATMAERRS